MIDLDQIDNPGRFGLPAVTPAASKLVKENGDPLPQGLSAIELVPFDVHRVTAGLSFSS